MLKMWTGAHIMKATATRMERKDYYVKKMYASVSGAIPMEINRVDTVGGSGEDPKDPADNRKYHGKQGKYKRRSSSGGPIQRNRNTLSQFEKAKLMKGNFLTGVNVRSRQ